jgi:hypothetical protein
MIGMLFIVRARQRRNFFNWNRAFADVIAAVSFRTRSNLYTQACPSRAQRTNLCLRGQLRAGLLVGSRSLILLANTLAHPDRLGLDCADESVIGGLGQYALIYAYKFVPASTPCAA